ncbi:hypothetical protein GUA46_06800 [Muricauda sp. HICW]|uniref:Uncharacterized protein n=1 Tax=Flagellimonas chongwuensis TaxID=2697365 RepID=A0A850NHS0_9FLAO|nr:hypothetical protein [Allomuricauda chongwuensis]NVN18042.1 hypothetical protein [Allomuricauda chongwuensis]
MTVNEFIANHDKQDFILAVKILGEENILFENQFSFLNDASMRRSRRLIRAFKHFGLEKDVHCVSWNIDKEGFMHCAFFVGDRFSTLQDVKRAHLNYFCNVPKNKICPKK